MKNIRIHQASFAVLGCCILMVSLMAGCSWSAEGDGFRVNSPPEDPEETATP